MYSQYVFVGVPLHTARIGCWFSMATTHWSNFCTCDGIDSQTILRTIRESKMAVTRHANRSSRRRASKMQMFVSHAHALKTTKPIMEYYKVDVSNPSPTFKCMSNLSWSPCATICHSENKLLCNSQ